jgi:hypothetical protein
VILSESEIMENTAMLTEFPVRFERDIAGGRVIGFIPDMGLVVFTSIGVPTTTSWWIVPGTHAE